MRHGVKISLSLLLILCIMALSCIPVHAAPVALTAAEELCALWAMYSESVGFSTIYSTNGTVNNFNNPFSASSAASNIADLYERYCTYSGRIETIQDTVAWIKTNTELAISNQQTGAFQYAAGVTEFFDKFSTWVLTDVVGVAKDATTGLFNTIGGWFNNTLSYNSAQLPAGVFDNYSHGNSYANSNAIIALNSSNQLCKLTINDSNDNPVYNGPIYVFYAPGSSSATWTLCLVFNSQYTLRDASIYVRVLQAQGSNYWSNTVNFTTSGGIYHKSGQLAKSLAGTIYVPYYESVSAGLDAYNVAMSDSDRIQLRPKDKYNEDVLDIPDVSSPDYAGTRVLEGITTVPWNDALSLDDILANVFTKSLANENVIADENSAPDPVINPLVPFDLPSLEFNFSGIWYYVVQWIGSLRSGFSFIASTWSALPFAMVIPIYASAVVVIVVGTFKRFFS